MSRKQLYDEAKALGLPVQWNTSTVLTLTEALAGHLRSTLNLGFDASFEEQFDHLAARLPELDAFLHGRFGTGSYEFMKRVEMGLDYLRCVGSPATIESLREAAVLIVGPFYSRSHPLNPHDNVERLRKAKRAVLRATSDDALGLAQAHRGFLMAHFSEWEMALTHDELDLYLG